MYFVSGGLYVSVELGRDSWEVAKRNNFLCTLSTYIYYIDREAL